MALDPNKIQQLPFVGSVAFQSFSTTLDGTPFQLKLRWNARDAAWYFDLADAQAVPILAGRKLVLGAMIGLRRPDTRLPGIFWVSDLAADPDKGPRDATFDDLGTRVIAYFYPFSGLPL